MSRHHRSRVMPAVVALAVGLAACSATVPAPSVAPTTRPSNAEPAALPWHACGDALECTSIRVPLDWFHRDDRMISLSIIRKKATGPNPIGSILLNPGGPGEPGTTFLRQLLESGTFPTELTRRFDVVSWDPRGTGDSEGIRCTTEAELTSPDPLPYPPTAAKRATVVRRQMAIQNRCLKKDATLIPKVGTIQTVHDLDAIRAALGDDRLTYVGFSYGTAIGLEYLRVFPSHVRAMALDGVDLPGTDPIATTHAQMASFEANLDRFLEDCRRDSECTFGAGNPQHALDAFLAELGTGKRIPASYTLPDDSGTSHTRNGTLGYTEAVTGIAAALYNQQSWPVLRGALAAASRPSDPDGHMLLALRDLLIGRQLDGTWNHSNEAGAAIGCADQRERARSFFGDPTRIERWRKELPVFGAFGAVGLPGCFRWPAAEHPLSRLTRAELRDAPPVVVVNSAHDPATPYANATKALGLLPGARLVTWGGADHTSFAGGHACIDDAVVPYLVSLKLPDAHLRCAAGTG